MNKDINRSTAIDVFKGIAIILVVLGHCTGSASSPVTNFINSFHMPMFFFASGLLFRRKAIDIIIIRKIQTLIVPLICFEVVNVFPKLFFFFIPSDLADRYLKVLQLRGQWFIIAIFLVSVTFACVDYMTKGNNIKTGLVCVGTYILGLTICWLQIDFINEHILHMLVGLFFYYLGYLFQEKGISSKVIAMPSLKKIILFFIATGMLVLIFLVKDNVLVQMYTNFYGNPFIFTMRAIVGTLAVYFMAMIMNKEKFIEFLGRNSLIMMVFHFPVYLGIQSAANLLKVNYLSVFPFNCLYIISVILITSMVAWIVIHYFPVIAGHWPKEKQKVGE